MTANNSAADSNQTVQKIEPMTLFSLHVEQTADRRTFRQPLFGPGMNSPETFLQARFDRCIPPPRHDNSLLHDQRKETHQAVKKNGLGRVGLFRG